MKCHYSVILVSLLIVAAVFLGPVRYTSGDPIHTLLTSESIIRHGTIQLDAYCKDNPATCDAESRIWHINNHYFHFLPIGNELISLPVVSIFNAFHLSMLTHGAYAQRVMAALSLLLCFAFMLKISRLFLSFNGALWLSSVYLFGTSLISTLGSALWSHDFAVAFSFISLYLALRMVMRNCYTMWPFLALSLFISYLCRPSLLMLVPFMFLFIFDYKKSISIKVALLFGFFVVAFMLVSEHYYGAILPPYYMPASVKDSFSLSAFYGHLFSPSRGLFVFSPFLFAIFFNVFDKAIPLRKSWLLIAIAWPLVHLIAMSSITMWWAGFAFGPRYMTDCLAGLFLLIVFSYKTRINSRYFKYCFICLCVLSIYINTWQGRFNLYAASRWNNLYLVNHPNAVFDWSISQAYFRK